MSEIHNVKDFLTVINKIQEENKEKGNKADLLFRGQQRDCPLLPRIARLKPKGSLLKIEELLLDEFKRTNPLLLRKYYPNNDWDFLTIGQHYGLPTRFLDWTFSALAALWFATGCNIKKNERSTYGVVFILLANVDDFQIKIEEIHPFKIDELKIYRPKIIKQRINSQSGVFSIQTSKMIENKCELDITNNFGKKLVKIKVPNEIFMKIREDLHILGINKSTIFPDLTGLCSHLQWRYFKEN